MADKHPTLGTITEAEIKLVEEHRANQHKLNGWRQGTQAVLNAFDNYDLKADGFVTGEPLTKEAAESKLKNIMWSIRRDMTAAKDNYKIY